MNMTSKAPAPCWHMAHPPMHTNVAKDGPAEACIRLQGAAKGATKQCNCFFSCKSGSMSAPQLVRCSTASGTWTKYVQYVPAKVLGCILQSLVVQKLDYAA